ncbi:hypothetical protein ACFLYV_01595 [Chloroflexota bacterium]
MKTRGFLVAYGAISVLGLMVMLSGENAYVVAALLLGVLLLGHREIWSLIRYRRLPVIDERVRNNLGNAMRLTGIFFFTTSLVLILLFTFNIFHDVPTGIIISGQLVVVGLVYLIGYQYYDRVIPNLGSRAVRWLKVYLVTAGLSLSTMALAFVLHNLGNLIGFEEAVFFILGLLVAPGVLAVCLLGSLVLFLKGLLASFTGGEPA